MFIQVPTRHHHSSRIVSHYQSYGKMRAIVDEAADCNFISEEKAMSLDLPYRSPRTGKHSWLSPEDKEVKAPGYNYKVMQHDSLKQFNVETYGRVRLWYPDRSGSTSYREKHFWVARGIPYDIIFGGRTREELDLNQLKKKTCLLPLELQGQDKRQHHSENYTSELGPYKAWYNLKNKFLQSEWV
ncbi:hypothetical protein K491DRAFT_774065 [Lophiostoma macrostomum CBS 122681]|uniref:Uncharacterized protein n=1 Tax=Lophiostoma macrostomum CBS 122681 TaxID=1314788 RepID=A0A6A6TQZ7_9PLEO|nr:hypothetical protein K491DRAFT_774065 [Lophiostoma macrostomum CBS 122681]